MAAITRTFKSFELTAYELDDSIPPSVRTAAQYVVLDTNMSARKARTAFRDAQGLHDQVGRRRGEDLFHARGNVP